jgi:hypothetical protein
MSTQKIGWGQKLPGAGDMYLSLKNKGDKVQFRIGQEPVHTGKHFSQNATGWDVTECPRIMENDECELCNQYFTISGKIKKLKAADKTLTDESPEIKKLRNEARPFQAVIQWHFPIVDREDGKFKILQTTNGVRNKFNALFEQGVDVMDTEWVLSNTGSASPAERYLLSAVDSKKVKDFTPEEEAEWVKAQGYDLTQIAGGQGDEE